MGKLLDAFSRKKKEEPVQEVNKQEEIKTGKYTRTWATRIAMHQGFQLSDDDKKIDGILEALNRRDGQCPCGGNGAQFKCPCVIMRTKGICKCGLYKTIEDRKIKTSTTASIKMKED